MHRSDTPLTKGYCNTHFSVYYRLEKYDLRSSLLGECEMKDDIEDLAIFGGVPTFDEPLHVGRPNLGDRQRLFKRINDMLDQKMAKQQRTICTGI